MANKLLSVIPTKNLVVFPYQLVPILVGRKKSMAALEWARKNGNQILTVSQKNPEKEGDLNSEDFYKTATLCQIEDVKGDNKNGYQVIVKGLKRYGVKEYVDEGQFFGAFGDVVEDTEIPDAKTSEILENNIKELAKEILALLPFDTKNLETVLAKTDGLIQLTHLVSQNMDLKISIKHEILDKHQLKTRALYLLEIMAKHRDELKLQIELSQKISKKMGKQQREHIMREQIKALQEELGDKSETPVDEYRKKIDDAKMPEAAAKVAKEQLDRLSTMSNHSPEYHVIRNYLDLLVALPWAIKGDEEIDLEKARKILEEDHYGLEKIKKRIVQHLATIKLKPHKKGSILLFVGPPGVGKTSLGKSIARALGRKFVRVSLGGVRDDAEIRGHRRTYVGALPGRIIDAIKKAGQNNPVFLLDEIDKLSRGWSGDPASALLEVLDPEQNQNFTDHYLDVPFDLSHVFFIGTANSLEDIPGPLLDRLEVIQLSGYTGAEKQHISEKHLVPKVLEEHGIKPEQLEILPDTQNKLITSYTREAGVRELQRKLAELVRSYSEKILEKGAKFPIKIKPGDLPPLLGPEKFTFEVAEMTAIPGVVTGLAWTPLGGEILFIESSMMPGKGNTTITGQLGDVMKESTQIAMSLLRSKLSALVSDTNFEKNDFHIHVPAGAIPKDGPSAGVTMLTSLASLLTNRKVNPRLAMTGEITLRGAVLPVGGIKEKMIAAQRAGIEEVIMSRKNEKDLFEVPDEVKSKLKFHFVETVEEVLKKALNIEPISPDFATKPAPIKNFGGKKK